MADWTDITDARLEPGKPARSIEALALRDNPIAIAEGATGAPRVQNAALGEIIFARKTSNQTRSNTSFTDVGDLSFDLGANETWLFNFNISANATGSASRPDLSISGPASPSELNYTFSKIYTAGDNTHATYCFHNTSYNTQNSIDSLNPFGNIDARLFGSIVNGDNAGTVTLRFRTNGTSGTGTIFRGSYLIAQRLP